MLLFSEQEFIYDHDNPPETLSNLIYAIQDKNGEENLICRWLILLDEIVIELFNSQDFSSTCLDENIEIVAAVNPTVLDKSFNVIPPTDKKFIFKRLTFKHRNSLEISVFLLHLKKKIKSPEVLKISTTESYFPRVAIADSDDMALVESSFPALDKV